MIELGQYVKDEVTGFKGFVIARSDYLHGCRRIGVQPKAAKDGKVEDAKWFDEPQLIVIGKKRVKRTGDILENTKKSSHPGGPVSSLPSQHGDPS